MDRDKLVCFLCGCDVAKTGAIFFSTGGVFCLSCGLKTMKAFAVLERHGSETDLYYTKLLDGLCKGLMDRGCDVLEEAQGGTHGS